MEQIIRTFKLTLSMLLIVTAAILALFYPVLSRGQSPAAKNQHSTLASFDAGRKNIFIIADAKSTEMFDMLAPFHVFNATGACNVFIVAKDKTPIRIKKDLSLLPQLTFDEVATRHLEADVIVIPALSARTKDQDPQVIRFITDHFNATTRIISICDGATTAATTGLYDGCAITAHASDLNAIRKQWDKPLWTHDVTVTKSDRRYSTAGVANAVEGSLVVVEDMLGKDARIKAAEAVRYPHSEIAIAHDSRPLTFGNKLSIGRRMFLSKKRRLGVLLHDGFSELKFAAIVDIYGRTYPKSIKTFTLQDSVVRSQFGLTFIHHGGNEIPLKMTEIYVVKPESIRDTDAHFFGGIPLISQNDDEYGLNQCIARIRNQFGAHYADVVKLTLDYN